MGLYIRLPYPPLPTLVQWASFWSIREANMCQCRDGQKGHSLLLHTHLIFPIYIGVFGLPCLESYIDKWCRRSSFFSYLMNILSNLTIDTSLSKALARWIRSLSSRLLIKLDGWVGSRTIVPLSLLYLPPLPP